MNKNEKSQVNDDQHNKSDYNSAKMFATEKKNECINKLRFNSKVMYFFKPASHGQPVFIRYVTSRFCQWMYM